MQLFSLLIFLHVTSGSIALLSGPFAIFNQNGGRVHCTAGKSFFWAMMLVAATGLTMAALKSNIFLLMVAVFSFYMAFSGRRALSLKQLHNGQKASWSDWLALVVCGLFGLGLLAFGLFLFLRGISFGIAAITFGTILLLRIFSDYRRFTRDNKDRKTWLYVHIGNMMGAYIAALTAFLVQNVHTEPAFIVWIAPTVLISPLISITIRKFQKGKPVPAGV
jgi:hypothetical protein